MQSSASPSPSSSASSSANSSYTDIFDYAVGVSRAARMNMPPPYSLEDPQADRKEIMVTESNEVGAAIRSLPLTVELLTDFLLSLIAAVIAITLPTNTSRKATITASGSGPWSSNGMQGDPQEAIAKSRTTGEDPRRMVAAGNRHTRHHGKRRTIASLLLEPTTMQSRSIQGRT